MSTDASRKVMDGSPGNPSPVSPVAKVKGRVGRPAWKVRGKGRTGGTPRGEMNKLETAYAAHLEGLKILGQVEWFAYEGLRFKLTEKTKTRPAMYYSPDFALMLPDGTIELHEVKGFQDAKDINKLKVAADKFPFVFRLVTRRRKKDGGGWALEEF